MMDIKICEMITKLIEKLATSGKEEIDKKVFRNLVGHAGKSEEYLKFSLERIFEQLEQKHSEIRLGAFAVVDELFKRSQYFREILLDDFHTFLELTVESNPSKLLPPPFAAAKNLKHKVLQTIHKWYSKFGDDHKRLALSYNFLKNNLKIDFQDALKRNASELEATRQEQERQSRVIKKKIAAIEAEMEENQEEIARIVTEMDNCFCLLIPKPEDAFGESLESDTRAEEKEQSFNLREHGFQGISTNLSIDMKDQLGLIYETEDNAAIIENLRDFHQLLKNRFLVMTKKWVAIASKSADHTIFKKVMDLKNMIEKQINQFNQIKLRKPIPTNESSSSSDDDSDFEDVPEKEGFEAEAISSPVLEATNPSNSSKPGTSKSFRGSSGWKLWDAHEQDARDPTTLLATLNVLGAKNKPSMSATATTTTPTESSPKTSTNLNTESTESRKEKLLKIAPKLPFDVDLYHWEDKNLKAPSIEIVETDGHKFWTPSQDRAGEMIEDPSGIASLRSRVIEFSGSFEPVKWSCRAPLPSGTLCPRKDRVKCPLHGKIIARDNMGNPTRPEDIQELEKAKELAEKNKPPEWQDPQFLKEIEAETGMDLTIRPPKKGKKKKTFGEMYPSLTDVEKKDNTPRSRLEKIVFNKSTMKRVAQTLDDQNSKRFRDKFGDQWNYSMNPENL